MVLDCLMVECQHHQLVALWIGGSDASSGTNVIDYITIALQQEMQQILVMLQSE